MVREELMMRGYMLVTLLSLIVTVIVVGLVANAITSLLSGLTIP